MVEMARALGMTTVYLEDLISNDNFDNMNRIYDDTEVVAALEVCVTSIICILCYESCEMELICDAQ